MKVSRNKIILAVLILIVLVGLITYKIISNKSDADLKKTNSCDEKNFFLNDYDYDIVLDKKEKYAFITSEEEYKEEKKALNFDDEEKLDFKNHDYLIYYLDAQGGCDRKYRLKCFEQKDKKVYLNFETQEIDDSCEIIFFDSLIIELEKDKYDKNLVVDTNI